MGTNSPDFEPKKTATAPKRRISFQYFIDSFLRSIDRFPVTLCYLLSFIVLGVTDCRISDSFVKLPPRNLQPALWFLTGNGILLTK